MNTFKKIALATGLCAAGVLGAPTAFAQSTDGYHTIQIFPVVVDTASFAQRFTFRNSNSAAVTISMTYFPATGTSQGVALNCGGYVVGAGADRTFNSLREICPTLAAGSQFGYLYTYETNSTNLPYSGFSRVANPQGNGFSVEAFPAHTFTSANVTVTGIRRIAATVSNPAFQTNCFVGNVNDITPPGVAVSTEITASVYDSAGVFVGSKAINLIPGQITRLLDVFNEVGKPTGDYNNARVTFTEFGTGEPGIMAFCTVQDNTSFGADFRIAKQESGDGSSATGTKFEEDDHVMRDSTVSEDVAVLGATTRTFSIPASVVNNAHIMYFRHPDWVQCEIIDPATGVRATAAYGLEMRLSRDDGTIIAGGNEVYGFGETYLGDKTDYNNGANGRYILEVESTATNTASIRPYKIHCQSGSGHTMGELLYYNRGDQF